MDSVNTLNWWQWILALAAIVAGYIVFGVLIGVTVSERRKGKHRRPRGPEKGSEEAGR